MQTLIILKRFRLKLPLRSKSYCFCKRKGNTPARTTATINSITRICICILRHLFSLSCAKVFRVIPGTGNSLEISTANRWIDWIHYKERTITPLNNVPHLSNTCAEKPLLSLYSNNKQQEYDGSCRNNKI